MALKVTNKGEANLESAKEQHKRLGKRSKAKGGNYERDVAKKFKEQYDEELTRTPQSGGFAKKSSKAEEFRGDIVALDGAVDLQLHIECKAHKVLSLPAWLSQSESDCPKGKIPVVIYHKHGTSKNYIVLDYLSFFGISAPPVSTICVQKPDIEASKLTDIEVATIRLRLNWGDNQKELADEYKVSVTTISRVAKEDYRNPLNLSFNFHYQKTWSLPAWFEQAESDAPKGKAPCVIFHKHGTSKDYIALSLEDFFKLVPKDRVIHKKVNM